MLTPATPRANTRSQAASRIRWRVASPFAVAGPPPSRSGSVLLTPWRVAVVWPRQSNVAFGEGQLQPAGPSAFRSRRQAGIGVLTPIVGWVVKGMSQGVY